MSSKLFDLSGKVALVTGGNGGIGLGYARGIAKQGGDVCIWGRSDEKLQQAQQELQTFGTNIHGMVVDVADEDAVTTAFADVLQHFGRVDACFANAGVGVMPHDFDELDSDVWRQVMSVNLDGLMFTLRAAVKHMKERAESGDPGGRLIATSSLGAVVGMAKSEAYSGSKGAVISIMQALAVQYARYKVTANSILPGHIETPMTEVGYQHEKYVAAYMPRIPARRWGTPQDFEGIAAYLTSDASQYHTGDKIVIDGGYFMF